MPATAAQSHTFYSDTDHSSSKPSAFVAPLRWPWATTRAAVISGMLRMLPVPFLDDYLVNLERRSMVKRLLVQNEIEYLKAVPRTLADWDDRTFGQKLRSFMKSLVIKPLKKLFRTVFFWLAVRDAGKTAVETYLLGRTVNQLATSDPVITESSQLTLYRSRRAAKAFAVAVKSIDSELMKHLTARFWKMAKNHAKRLLSGGNVIASGSARSQRDVVEQDLEDVAPGFIAKFEKRFEDQFSPSV